MPAFRLRGALDATTVETVRAELTDLLGREGTDDLVVDLHDIGFLDTVGLGLLVGIHRQALRRGRRLVLTGVPPHVMRVLAITKLRRVLTIDRVLTLDGELNVADDAGDGAIQLSDPTVVAS